MSADDVRRPIQLTLALMNASLHTLGFVLLVVLYRKGRRTVQVMYLANISLSEGLMNYIRLVYCIIRLFPDTFQRTTHSYFWIPLRSGLYYMYFFSMFFLTLDRLLTILFVVKFSLFWGKRKTMFLLISMWILNITITVALLALHHFTGYDTHRNKVSHFYIPSVFNVLFLLFAILAYSLMFWRFASNRKAIFTPPVKPNSPPLSLFQIFRNSKFFVPILLISTFLILTVVPNLVHAILRFTKSRRWYSSSSATPFKMYNWISIYLSDTADGLIYIMMYKPVRNLLWKAIDECFKKCCGIDPGLSETDGTSTTVVSHHSIYRVNTAQKSIVGKSREQHSLKCQDNIPLLEKYPSVKSTTNRQAEVLDAPTEALPSLTEATNPDNEELISDHEPHMDEVQSNV